LFYPKEQKNGSHYPEREEADHLVKCLELHEERIAAPKRKMAERAKGDRRIERLESVPGAGPTTAFAFGAFANGDRFGNGGQAGSYPGLVRSKNGGALKERYEYMTQEKKTGGGSATGHVCGRGLLQSLIRVIHCSLLLVHYRRNRCNRWTMPERGRYGGLGETSPF
jgi:hypothetical protein